jgi:hypothetical protein
LLHAVVHPAGIQDRDGGVLVLATLFGLYPFLQKLFADGGYQGPVFRKGAAKILPHLKIEIVKRSDQAKVAAAALGCRTNNRLAQPLPQTGQGLRKSEPQRARLPPPRLSPPDVTKAM